MNVTVRPALLRWARERASLTIDELAGKVGTKKNPAPVQEWESAPGEVEIPVRKLELIAEKTRAPYGMLFLEEPPVEPFPIRDFRRPEESSARPSLNLLETIYEVQLRQEWLSERFREDGEEPRRYVRSATLDSDLMAVAADIRSTLNIGTVERRAARKGADAVLWMIGRLEESGITVIRKGYAGRATRRSLDPAEFKGFALSDAYAPFIFINGKDWPASQMFTLAHECVHLWLGESALPDGNWLTEASNPTERFCNRVAAEVLVPRAELEGLWDRSAPAAANARVVAEHFKVSALAALVRARNADLITEAAFGQTRRQMDDEFREAAPEAKKPGGGNFYNNAGIHLGKRFIREVLTRTMEGRTLYSEAFDLLGTRKTSVVQEMAHRFL